MKNRDYKKTIWTVNDVLKWTTDYLKVKGCQSPRLDAELLLAHALKTNRLGLYLIFDQPLSDRERMIYRELVRRRASREPVAFLVGKKEFWSLDIMVRPGVLVPRPETEILLEVVLEECKKSPGCSLLEVGCGSGAVICALFSEVPDIDAYACDISMDALQNTGANLALLFLRLISLNRSVMVLSLTLFSLILRISRLILFTNSSRKFAFSNLSALLMVDRRGWI
jgi:release factor glutamine methyltransferase